MHQSDSIEKEVSQKYPQESFSNYGIYTIKDSLQFALPNTVISFQRLGKDKYSYSRENSQSTPVEDYIAIRTADLEVEFAPTYPINVPAYRTDYVFLKFEKSIFVSMKSSTEIFVPVPIENAFVFTGSEIREHVDVFSCFPSNSRYGLYGPPEYGRLCKFAKIAISSNDKDFESFLFAKMKVKIENKYEEGVKVGHLIFPVTNHDLYYKDKSAVFDTLKVIIKDRLGLVYANIEHEPISLKGWTKAPRRKEKTDHEFSMKWGFT